MVSPTQNISDTLLRQMAEFDRQRTEVKEKGIPAVQRLYQVAQGGSGQCHALRRFLLALYNGQEWPFDLTRLRGLDAELHTDCMAVLALDAWGGREVHAYVASGEELAQAFWGREGGAE